MGQTVNIGEPMRFLHLPSQLLLRNYRFPLCVTCSVCNGVIGRSLQQSHQFTICIYLAQCSQLWAIYVTFIRGDNVIYCNKTHINNDKMCHYHNCTVIIVPADGKFGVLPCQKDTVLQTVCVLNFSEIKVRLWAVGTCLISLFPFVTSMLYPGNEEN